MIMNKKKIWSEMDFEDKLLYYWDQIEMNHNAGNIELRNFFKFMLKKDLGVICNNVYI